MAKIAEHYIERLRTAGLFVSPPFPSDHAIPDGVRVGKPASIPGNSIPGYETGYVLSFDSPDDRISFNAPTVYLFSYGGKWIVEAIDHCPIAGPGDFVDDWDTPEEALNDILDFYFGNPARMEAKAEVKRRKKRELDNPAVECNSLSNF